MESCTVVKKEEGKFLSEGGCVYVHTFILALCGERLSHVRLTSKTSTMSSK